MGHLFRYQPVLHFQLHPSYSEREPKLFMRTRIPKELLRLLTDYHTQVTPPGIHRLKLGLLYLGIQSALWVHFCVRVSSYSVDYLQRVTILQAILAVDSLMAV